MWVKGEVGEGVPAVDVLGVDHANKFISVPIHQPDCLDKKVLLNKRSSHTHTHTHTHTHPIIRARGQQAPLAHLPPVHAGHCEGVASQHGNAVT